MRWEVARDPGLRQIVTRGRVSTGPEQDFTLKVDATGLRPGRTYYYPFNALGEASTSGRTRTLPVDSVERLRCACSSYANYPRGFVI